MREDLLHFIWKYKKLQLGDLAGTSNESVKIVDVGSHNHLAGPDFFNAKIEIQGQLWAGNVEIHIKSSDWYAHGHEQDPGYNNVILHVVWEDDCEVFRSDNSRIPTLELKGYISVELLDAYRKLHDKKGKSFINCERDLTEVDGFLLENWLERLYFERLESKSRHVFDLLNRSKNDWEQVLFTMLLKNFGLKINGPAFSSLADTLGFSVVRKLRSDLVSLESVLFGMSHLLEDETTVDDYYLRLQNEYAYQRNKFDLRDESVRKPDFFKLRPVNFPTIRLSQFANLYFFKQNLFDAIVNTKSLKGLYELFDVSASEYWNDHFTFGKSSKKSTKRLSNKFIDLLVINTILPLKFCHAKHWGKMVAEEIDGIISEINVEKNGIISNFEKSGLSFRNAKNTQAALQLYNTYCTQNRCLQCAVGSNLLNRNS